MKKLIGLTEGQLHEMITESVNQILSELDWKTYANYAKKRLQQGKYDKAQRGNDMANTEFNKKYNNKNWKDSATHDYNIQGYIHQDERPNMIFANSTAYKRSKYDPFHHGENNEFLAPDEKRFGDYVYVPNHYSDSNDGKNTWVANFPKNGQGYFNYVDRDPKDLESDESFDNYHKRTFLSNLKDAVNDMNAYHNNKSKYIKGKGWVNQ